MRNINTRFSNPRCRQIIYYFSSLCCLAFSNITTASIDNDVHEQWLKEKFSAQHEALMPYVAVANIFSGCNQARKFDPINYQVKDLVLKMDKQLLSDKVIACLGADQVQSETAINFGLLACFQSQFTDLSKQQQREKMMQVAQALEVLSLDEKKKSFTECTTFQAIKYLK
ncbi:MAG: hypothetical protein ACSHW0_06080 [Thalassotalea sp.]